MNKIWQSAWGPFYRSDWWVNTNIQSQTILFTHLCQILKQNIKNIKNFNNFLKLFIHWSPVAYGAPTDLGSSSFSVLSFYLFILFMGVLKARILKWFAFSPLPSPVDHILSELSTMTRPSWVSLHGMVHSFIELDKAVVHVIRVVSFLWLWFSVCLSSDGEG